MLKSLDGKALLSYLADIFERLNILNKQLQGEKVTLLDAKIKIFGFVRFLELSKGNILTAEFSQFECLSKCKVTNNAKKAIVGHMAALIEDFNERFEDIKCMKLPPWISQPFSADLGMPSQSSKRNWQGSSAMKTWRRFSNPKV